MSYLVSTYSSTASLRLTLGRLQVEMARRQQELATGRRADLAASLGAQAGRSYSIGDAIATISTIQSTNQLVSARLDLTQTSLDALAAAARGMRATLLAAQTDGGEPAAIVTQARNALSALIASLNSSDGGAFLFAGANAAVAPIANYFADPPPANKRALDAAFVAAFGFSQTDPAVAGITSTQMESFLSGRFRDLFSPAGWKADWSVAADEPLRSQVSISLVIESSVTANDHALRKLAEAYAMVGDLGAANMNGDAYRVVLRQAMQTIDSAIDHLTRTQARVGVMRGTVRNASETMNVQSAALQSQLHDLEAVEQTETAARINDLMTQIETSFTLTSRISQLNLARYL